MNKSYLIEQDKYFLLEVSFFGKIINEMQSIIPHLGRIYLGVEWERRGFLPYNIVEKSEDGIDFLSFKFGSHEINGHYFSFRPLCLDEEILLDDELVEYKAFMKAIHEGKRYIQVPDDMYHLKFMGVSYSEISNLTELDRLYTEGRLAMDVKDYHCAISIFRKALKLDPENHNLIHYLSESRIYVGDLSLINEQMTYFFYDMDCAIHSNYAIKWLRLAIDVAKDYKLVLDVALTVLSGVDRIIKEKPAKKARVFSGYNKESCKAKRYWFLKRLSSLRGFLKNSLIEENLERSEHLRRLLIEIKQCSPEKEVKIDNLIRSLDCLR